MTVVAPRSAFVQKTNLIKMSFTVYGLGEDPEVHFPWTWGAEIDEVICAMPGVCLRSARDYTLRDTHMYTAKTGDRGLVHYGTNQKYATDDYCLTLHFDPGTVAGSETNPGADSSNESGSSRIVLAASRSLQYPTRNEIRSTKPPFSLELQLQAMEIIAASAREPY